MIIYKNNKKYKWFNFRYLYKGKTRSERFWIEW